ncbi:unnamed protein product [Peronospora destructor]|uniref:Selenoprotein F n=1 Tax=Peronospora destructor TaxID=86335 RepID=A0AAV0TND7_9STRA|nr:unnamed protein product [Peronospora destructor]
MKVPTLLLFGASVAAQEVSESIATFPRSSTLSSEHVDQCATLGFDVNALDCRLCDDLSTFLTATTSKTTTSKSTSVQLIGQECQKCCLDFSRAVEAEDRRYAKAVLAVNPYRLKRYPRVANFVEHQASEITGLEVQETTSRLPTLQFFDKTGVKIEEISVASWDEDSIGEFIDTKLLLESTLQEENDGVEEGETIGEMEGQL